MKYISVAKNVGKLWSFNPKSVLIVSTYDQTSVPVVIAKDIEGDTETCVCGAVWEATIICHIDTLKMYLKPSKEI